MFSAVDQNDRPQLYLRQLDEPTARPIRERSGRNTGCSPDGRWIAYCVDPEQHGPPHRADLLKVSLDGAPPIRLTSTTVPLGMSWMGDGSITPVSQKVDWSKVRQPWRAAAHHSASKRRAESPTTARVAGQPQRLAHGLSEIDRWDDAFVAVEDLDGGAPNSSTPQTAVTSSLDTWPSQLDADGRAVRSRTAAAHRRSNRRRVRGRRAGLSVTPTPIRARDSSPRRRAGAWWHLPVDRARDGHARVDPPRRTLRAHWRSGTHVCTPGCHPMAAT